MSRRRHAATGVRAKLRRACKHPAASIDRASDKTRSSPKASRAIAPTNRRPLIVYEAEVCSVGAGTQIVHIVHGSPRVRK